MEMSDFQIGYSHKLVVGGDAKILNHPSIKLAFGNRVYNN